MNREVGTQVSKSGDSRDIGRVDRYGFSESKPVPCTNSFREKRLSILASCMANLFKFHAVFSSSTLIRLDKDAFEGHSLLHPLNFVTVAFLVWVQTVTPYSIKERIKEK